MEDALYQFKVSLLNTGIFKRQNGREYTCTCPFCLDHKKHCYVLFDMVGDTPVLYNCFKCASKGIVDYKFLEFFGLENSIKIPKCKTIRKIQTNQSVSSSINTEVTDLNYSNNINIAKKYIHDRVGVFPDDEDLKSFQMVSNPCGYIRKYIDVNAREKWFNDRVWFKLTNGTITGRSIVDNNKQRWMKYRTDKVDQAGCYVIRNGFDMHREITVCIAEGIMDVIGLYYLFNKSEENCLYVAVLGKSYESGIKHILNRGIFGNSVNIKIFRDPDVERVFIDRDLKKLFKSVHIYENANGNDFGVDINTIEIQKVL